MTEGLRGAWDGELVFIGDRVSVLQDEKYSGDYNVNLTPLNSNLKYS